MICVSRDPPPAVLPLQVAGQSHRWALQLLNYEDEVFALVSLLLERHSLATLHATFAESLYGLKRRPAAQQQQQTPLSQRVSSTATASGGVQQAAASEPTVLLTSHQQRQALLCQVIMFLHQGLSC